MPRSKKRKHSSDAHAALQTRRFEQALGSDDDSDERDDSDDNDGCNKERPGGISDSATAPSKAHTSRGGAAKPSFSRALGSRVGPERHERYYRGAVVGEGDWKGFASAMRRPLPVTLRLELSHAAGSLFAERFAANHPLSNAAASGLGRQPGLAASAALRLDHPAAASSCCLGGVPGAVLLPCDKRSLKADPSKAALHGHLAREMLLGHLSRQEVVSMLPVVVAAIQPGMRVLELCCCPGSKTRQILSALTHGGGGGGGPGCGHPESSGTAGNAKSGAGGQRDSGGAAGGLLVANDSDAMRVDRLALQFERSAASSGSPALVLTNARGTDLCFAIANANANANATGPKQGQKQKGGEAATPLASLLFDAVLVDVPCSGDGTFRKAPEVWRQWTPAHGSALQPVQVDLLAAAAAATKPGGLIVYSTCSLNPVENEEVVAMAMALVPDLELLDARAAAGAAGCTVALRPGLRLGAEPGAPAKGAYSWTLPADPPPLRSNSTWWAALPLERCGRAMPQDNDAGGFFVALLRRRRESAASVASAMSVQPSVSPAAALAALKRVGFACAAPPRADAHAATGQPFSGAAKIGAAGAAPLWGRPATEQEALAAFDQCGLAVAAPGSSASASACRLLVAAPGRAAGGASSAGGVAPGASLRLAAAGAIELAALLPPELVTRVGVAVGVAVKIAVGTQ